MLQIIQNDHEVPAGNILGNLSVPSRVLHPYLGKLLHNFLKSATLV